MSVKRYCDGCGNEILRGAPMVDTWVIGRDGRPVAPVRDLDEACWSGISIDVPPGGELRIRSRIA